MIGLIVRSDWLMDWWVDIGISSIQEEPWRQQRITQGDQEAPRTYPGSAQEAPRMHPRSTQEAPRKHPKGIQETKEFERHFYHKSTPPSMRKLKSYLKLKCHDMFLTVRLRVHWYFPENKLTRSRNKTHSQRQRCGISLTVPLSIP